MTDTPILPGISRILIACEYSGTVRDAMRSLGHDAVSNDILPTTVAGPHIQGDCLEAVLSEKWDMIIMHPPCTALAVSGNRWYGQGMPKNAERHKAIEWTVDLWEAAKEQSDRVCMENPVGVLPIKATQYIHPWQFGHGETKRTGLWLHGLPELVPTDIVEGRENLIHRMPPSKDRGLLRSKTYQGIADAMAAQWGAVNRNE